MRLFTLLLLPLSILGCAKTNTYQVTLRNDLDQPITVWLTKSGPPAEANWLSPEQIAIGENPAGGRMAGSPVPPGKVAETGKIKGHFPQGTQAVLRVYLGQHTLDELLAINRNNKSQRLDVWLKPGKTNIIIRQENNQLLATPASGKL